MQQAPPSDDRGPGLGIVVLVAAFVSVVVSGSLVGLAALVWLAASAGAPEAETEWPDDTLVEDGLPPAVDVAFDAPVEGTFAADGETLHAYRFDLPDDVVHVRMELRPQPSSRAETDLDLRAAFGDARAEQGEYDATSTSSGSEEWISFTRDDLPEMGRTPLIVVVERYAHGDAEDDAVDYELVPTVVRHEVAARLAPGESARAVVSPDTGHRAAFEVVLPDGVDAVCVDVADVRQDVDLAADVTPVLDPATAAAVADTDLGRETLVLDRGALRLGPGEHVLHVTVIDRNTLARRIPLELHVSAGSATPDALRRLPRLPVPDGERAARGVVHLIAGEDAGSGVVVGSAGRILTAAHVVEGVPDGEDGVIVCVTTVTTSEPLELLRGRVVRRDEERDVALVEVTSTLHRDPVPDGWQLPGIDLRRTRVALGETAHACGFPVLHGPEERSEITWTSGVVCGFERPDGFLLLRFDAEVSSGSSGGALLDAEHRLIGITTALHGDLDTFSATGLALPVSELPAEWAPLLE